MVSKKCLLYSSCGTILHALLHCCPRERVKYGHFICTPKDLQRRPPKTSPPQDLLLQISPPSKTPPTKPPKYNIRSCLLHIVYIFNIFLGHILGAGTLKLERPAVSVQSSQVQCLQTKQKFLSPATDNHQEKLRKIYILFDC